MASHNDITGDVLVSKIINKNFSKGFDGIDWSATIFLVLVFIFCFTSVVDDAVDDVFHDESPRDK